jgi:hypothetical protein
MRTAMKVYPTCVALMLALVAAVMSTHGQAGIPHRALQLLQVGACAELNTLTGAIGETQASCPAP